MILNQGKYGIVKIIDNFFLTFTEHPNVSDFDWKPYI